MEKDPNYWPTLVKRNAARLFISEADLSANKTRSQRGKCSISFKSQRVRVFTAGTWTRCTDYSLLSISLLQPHSFRIRPFRFPSLSLGICLVALSLFSMPAWQSIRTSFPLFSSVVDLGFRVFCRFSILSSDVSASWVASKELLVSGKITRVWINNFLQDQFLLDSDLFDFLLYSTVLLFRYSTERSAQLFGLRLFHTVSVLFRRILGLRYLP